MKHKRISWAALKVLKVVLKVVLIVVLAVVLTVVLTVGLNVVPTVVPTVVPSVVSVPTVLVWKESALFSPVDCSVLMRGRLGLAELFSASLILSFLGTSMTLSISSRSGSSVLVTMLYLMFTFTFSGLTFRFVIIRRFSCINLSSFWMINNKSSFRESSGFLVVV